MLRPSGCALALTLILSALGCSTRPVDKAIDHVDLSQGYRPQIHPSRKHLHDTQILITFSGGGTRAAAFAYGVLEELRQTPVAVARDPHPLSDEIDLIIGVSGGSFTALAFGLRGDRLFDTYEQDFLKRDVQGALIARALDPREWGTLASRGGGRSELAANYYDEILFHGATFADLAATPGPYVIATGTDISTGARLSFAQSDFDALCTDLSPVRLARAAATSSAVPVVLSPVTFDNHGGHCGYHPPVWVNDALSDSARSADVPVGRLRQRYREITDFERGDGRPFLHLVDGGVADNLGLRALLERFMQAEASPAFRSQLHLETLQRTLLIVVNARSAPATHWDRSEDGPGALDLLLQSISVPIDRESDESMELMRDLMARWQKPAPTSTAGTRAPRFFVANVSLDAVPDAAERGRLLSISTSFSLPADDIDHLRQAAAHVLRSSPEFQAFLRDLAGSD